MRVNTNLQTHPLVHQEIDKLRKSVSAIEAVVQPKKKFSFRNKTTKKPSAEAVPVVAL